MAVRKMHVLLVAVVGGFGALLLPTTAGATTASQTPGAGRGLFIPAPLPPSAGSVLPRVSPLTEAITAEGSSNWSGYAQSARRGTFTSVVDTWQVPTVSTSNPGFQLSSDWVGIGGFKDSTLVQAGTEADNDNGTPFYQAWTEILPAASDPLSMTINPGDSITTVVEETSPGTWLMQVTDNTTGVTQGRTVTYASSGSSAEAIHEATSLCSPCVIAPLATTTNVTFDPGTFTSVLQPTPQPLLVPAVEKEKVTRKGIRTKVDNVYELLMIGSGNTVIATPSAPNAQGNGFTVADGPIAPSPPS
ncbi:MAG TPA: G1 family glutamic endopeptidase [Acidimicrobiales bacterium]|nr:G1 family glutamic endopeptidase [Acidimicrobiales bacterium]